MVNVFVGFNYWEWEEGFEILVFEQFALSKIKQEYTKTLTYTRLTLRFAR